MTARYALGAAVWTRDVARAHRVARDVNAGVTLQRTGMQCDAMSCHAPRVARDANAGVARINARAATTITATTVPCEYGTVCNGM